jgi:hypothetical protein
MLFRRKPKPPLAEAIRMVSEATEAAYKYLRDRGHMPTEDELRLLNQLAETLWTNHATAQYISRNMHQRSRGEPEGAKKFTDEAAADYHYPS